MEQAELGTTMERFLEMHMYITSALQKSDMKAVGLQLALELLHEKVILCKNRRCGMLTYFLIQKNIMLNFLLNSVKHLIYLNLVQFLLR